MQTAYLRALRMTDLEAAEILTWTDEPELIAAPGQTPPAFSPEDVAAARLKSDWTRPTAAESAAIIAQAARLGLPMGKL